MANKIWTKEEIAHLLETNDTMVVRSLMKLYACQTVDEKAASNTKHTNARGFNHPDAPLLSSMARYCIARKGLTTKQVNKIRPKMIKYSGQLARMANGEE